MTRRLTILGCGSSGGVPRLGPNWGQCDPANPRNRRRRASILLDRFSDQGRTSVLVDTSPDMREQLIDCKVSWLDGVLFSHDHADHTHGIDDLRMIAFNGRRKVDVYLDEPTRHGLETRFRYCFRSNPGSMYPPILETHPLAPLQPVIISGKGGVIETLPLDQEHGDIRSLGFRIGNVAYSSDASGFPGATLERLRNLDVWILGALRYLPHPAHFSVSQALAMIEKLKPRRAILTHLHVDLDYDKLRAELPANVEPAFDGMTIDIDTGVIGG